MTMHEAFARGTEIANRWPMLVVIAVLMGGFGFFAYDLSARSDKRETELNAATSQREAELLALAKGFADHIKERNTEMTRMLQSCIVVPDKELLKLRQDP